MTAEIQYKQYNALSMISFVAGFASIIGSILIWYTCKEPDLAHGERFGIFIGLWAPTFFALSTRIDRLAAASLHVGAVATDSVRSR